MSAVDTSAEEVATRRRVRRRSRRANPIGATPLLAIVAAAGLMMIALGNNAAREQAAGAEPLFWLGLAMIYGPISYRLISSSATRVERLGLCVLLGLSLFVVRILYSPTASSPYDELATWRQVDDLIRTGHAFTDNPVAAGYPAFPGLELVSAAVANLAGVSIFHAGLIVIGTARMILVLALFLFLERVTGSARAAGIGIALYVCNPSFLFFDSQFHHEPMALALGATLLLVTLRWTAREGQHNDLGLIVALTALAVTLTITHHMTSYAIALFLLAWTAVDSFLDRRQPRLEAIDERQGAGPDPPWIEAASGGPGLAAAIMTVVPAAWFLLVAGSDTIEELGGIFTGAIDGVISLLFGSDEPKALFSGGGPSNAFAAKLAALASVIALLAVIALASWRIWKRRRSPAIWWTLAGAATLYPITLAVRLTQAATETAQRASAFVFVGVAFLTGLLFALSSWPHKKLGQRTLAAGLAVLATITFIGGVIIGKVPATRQPGPFLVGADARSIGPPGLAAAHFAAEHLPRDSRVVVDRSNSTLLGSYGGLSPVQGQIDGVPVARILFDPDFGPGPRFIVRENTIDYIAIDRRLSLDLPILGFYFEPDEPGASTRTAPIGLRELKKFDDVPELSRIYNNGNITIYDTAGLQEE